MKKKKPLFPRDRVTNLLRRRPLALINKARDMENGLRSMLLIKNILIKRTQMSRMDKSVDPINTRDLKRLVGMKLI